MDRTQRIEAACQMLTTEAAKDAFRKTAAQFPDMSIFWDEDDPHAMLADDSVSIEFRALT